MSNKSRTCATCHHWEEFAENDMAGRCKALGAIIWPKAEFENLLTPATDTEDFKLQAEISLTGSYYSQNPVTEVIAVRTTKNFGCVFHFFREQKQIADPSRVGESILS